MLVGFHWLELLCNFNVCKLKHVTKWKLYCRDRVTINQLKMHLLLITQQIFSQETVGIFKWKLISSPQQATLDWFLCQRKHFLLLLWVHKNTKEQFKFCKYAAGLQKNCQWKICGTLPEDLLTSTLMLDSLVKLEKLTEIFFNTFRLWFDYHWPNVMI